jgi:outer membrane protein assembly factor BamB
MIAQRMMAVLLLLCLATWWTPLVIAADLLIGNTRAGNIVRLSSNDGSITEFLADVSDPDHIQIVDEVLYVSVGTMLNESAIVRMDLATGAKDPMFCSGNGLRRPYGFDFYQGRIYVASFRSDEILVYDMMTGDFIEVFASGNGTEEGLLNGPNHIAIYGTSMYVTTQGSVADDSGEVSYMFPSQILMYDLDTAVGSVFVPQPEPLPQSMGYVSMLGIRVYCTGTDDCLIYTTDFAGGLRSYTLDGELVYAVETTYVPGSTTGSLAIADGEIFVPAFVNETTPGVVLKFALDGTSELSVVAESNQLVRPIGIHAVETKTARCAVKRRRK